MNDQKPEEVKAEVVGVPEDKPSGLAITALVLGIVGVVCSWVIVLNFALGIAALIIGIIEFKKIGAGTRLPHFFAKLRLKQAFCGHYNFLIM